jgi:DNA polymerase III subunit gamma/tau
MGALANLKLSQAKGLFVSYQVIARKWRPPSFQDLVGQPHVTQTLLNALRSNRLPHALIFSGARGVGKTSSARILAKSLRCPNAKDFVPCNQCRTCEEIGAGRSLDVIEIDGASNNGVDAIRELRETVGYMPSSGKYKVYIIDEVHMLSTSAFNALLKTLEEPPGHVIFIFATTEPQKIPVTILSRCQRFDFRRIPTREIAEHLDKICKAEKISAEPEGLWSIARQAEGSMRDSQSLLDQVITFTQGHVTQKNVTEVLGLTDRDLLIETVRMLGERNAPGMLEVIRRIYGAGYDAKTFAHDLLEQMRNLLLVKLSPDRLKEIVDLPESELTSLQEIASALSEEDIHLMFDMALKGGNDIPRAQSPISSLKCSYCAWSLRRRLRPLLNC